jgi:SAM-dependent methyltransferase
MDPQPEKPPAFDDYASDYAALIRDPLREKFADGNQFFFQRKVEVILAFFRRTGIRTENADWVDIGCGQGDLLRAGSRYFKSAAGCDPSKGMLKACNDLDVRHQTSMDSLPFADRSKDFVTAVCVYHHVPLDRRQVLTAEAARVLKPGGAFCIIEHNPWNPMTRLIVSRTPVDADARLLAAREAASLLSSAGLAFVETQFFLLFPERLHRFTRPLEDALRRLPLGGQYAVFGNSGSDV